VKPELSTTTVVPHACPTFEIQGSWHLGAHVIGSGWHDVSNNTRRRSHVNDFQLLSRLTIHSWEAEHVRSIHCGSLVSETERQCYEDTVMKEFWKHHIATPL